MRVTSTPFIELISLREQEVALALRKIYMFEPVAAAVALTLLLPVLVAVAAAITALSRRSPLIRHTRVGWRGETLEVWKFRTMWGAGEVVDWDPTIKSPDDPRVTSRFAAWCRRASIDELPQLFHVMRGQMSFVGPRPITRVEIDKFYSDCTGELLSVRPGLTGLWQLMGRNHLSYAKRRELDLLFVKHASVGLYFSILLRTVPKVLSGSGAY
jgi:lipopolysaccharide/colanic/teichoic acid biosynthesis glycosyltransferase